MGLNHDRAELKQNTEDHSHSPRSNWALLRRLPPHEDVSTGIEFELPSRNEHLHRKPTCNRFEGSTSVLSTFLIDNSVKAMQVVTEHERHCTPTQSVDELNVAIEAVGGF